MEDRRISKRKIKRPSYLDNFHIGDAKDSKPQDSTNKGQGDQKAAERDSRPIKIKPRSSVKEGKKATEALKKGKSISSLSGRGLESKQVASASS